MTTLTPRVSYTEIIRLFLRMSVISFGGPMAHIAMGEDEIVTRRGWLTREHYLDLIAATNLIPGPNSTEVMIHVGYVLRGIPGAIVSGLCFITPAFLITLVLTALYVAGGTIPALADALWGIQPVIVAIIAVAAYRLAPSALKRPLDWALLALSIAAIAVLDVPEVIVMLATGVVCVFLNRGVLPGAALIAFVPVLLQAGETALTTVKAGALDLFWYFLRIGSVLFGSGYILVSYIEQDLVNTFGWITARQLFDAVAIGQFTPGPVLTTAGAVGYIVDGVPGAILATVGVFLPAFVLVILTAPLILRMRQIPALRAFLSGVNIGVIAAIMLTVVRLAIAAIGSVDGGGALDLSSGMALAIGVAAAVALVRFRINATWLILIGAALGWAVGAML
ncbi:MAG: chromate efflux transporter [Chloroflexota bacterium]|nr:chromate efflux transporter [Chloroflexota bacterium]